MEVELHLFFSSRIKAFACLHKKRLQWGGSSVKASLLPQSTGWATLNASCHLHWAIDPIPIDDDKQ
jgi:hypothetical protein